MDNRYFSALWRSLFNFTRWRNFLRYKLQVSKKPGQPAYLPYVLDIEPTTACNFRCRMCQVSSPGFLHTHMPLSLFQELIRNNPQLFKIKLQGMGEPFANPHIFEMISFAVNRNILVEVITNGSFFSPENIEKILDSGLTRLTVSMDGADTETFEKIRAGSNFNDLTAGIKALTRTLAENKSNIHLSAWTVLQRENAPELPALVRLCRSLGFSDLTFQGLLTSWGKEDWRERNEAFSVTLEDGVISRHLEEALTLGKELNFPVRLYTGGIYSTDRPCAWPWHSAYIDCRGEVVPCCIVADSRVKSFGPLVEGSLAKAWTSEAYKAFREEIKSNRIPSFCRDCYGRDKKS